MRGGVGGMSIVVGMSSKWVWPGVGMSGGGVRKCVEHGRRPKMLHRIQFQISTLEIFSMG